MKRFTMLVTLLLLTVASYAHVWEIRVNQAQNGTLTWYLQSYHSVSECGIANSGLTINGVNYPLQAAYTGSIVGLSNTIFATTGNWARGSYAIVQTPFLGTNLNVQPYSSNVCWAFMVGGSGNFTPPPPPVCTTCPITGWSNTTGSPLNNGTACDKTDDILPATVTVNHLSCASITTGGKFRVIYDPAGANISYGPYNFTTGITTSVNINLPYGVSNSTQLNVVSDSFPCNIAHGLNIPGGSFNGITETILPTINCPGNIIVNNDANACGAVVTYTTPVGTDNCSGANTVQTAGLPSGSLFPIGTTTNTFKVTDANNNSSTCSFTVTVNDVQNPVIANCPANITRNVTPGQCGTNVSWILPPVAPTVDQQLTAINIGTWGADQWQSFTAGMNGQLTQVDLFHNGIQATDFTLTIYSGTGTSGTVLYSGYYNYGTFGSGWFGVTIPSGSQPTLVAGNTYTMRIQGNGLGMVASYSSYGSYYSNVYGLNPCWSGGCWKLNFKTYVSVPGASPMASDNCGIDSFTSTHSPNDYFPVGTTAVTYKAKDIHGNTSSCSFNVTVVDNQAPSITCPANITVNNDAGMCGAVVNYTAPTGTDNCPGASTTQIAGLASGSVFPVGSTTNTFKVTDAAGLSTTCSFTVTVKDAENPAISCPANISVNNDAGICGAVVNYTAPIGTDNCAGATTTQTSGLPSGSVFPIGNTINTFEVVDAAGNKTSCSFTVNVADTEIPTISAVNVTVNADNGACAATNVNLGIPTTGDNCGVQGTSNDGPASYPVGTTTVNWTVADVNGNTNTTTQTVTVVDNQNPTISIGNVTVNADNGACAATNVNLGTPTTGDNCGVQGTSNDGISSYPVGSTTVTWTVTDIHGNTGTTTQTVTVVDNQNPTIACPADVTVNADNGSCAATNVSLGAPTTDDNCGVQGTSNNALSSYPVGTTVVTWTVTDIHGNSATCSQNVTVVDNQAPVASCKPYTLNLSGGTGTVSASDVDNNSTDNCGIASISVSPNTFNCANAGENTVVMTVTDIHGNSSTCATTVNVQYQPTCSISTTPSNNTYTGGNPNNIYLGYGPQSATITANATGGTGFTYSWSPAANLSCTNCQSPVFTPTAAGNYTYTVTVTNSNGCSTTCTVSFCVLDARAKDNKGNYNGKVYLCHVPPGNPNNPQTLSISANAVPSHLGQHSGDRLGKCDMSCNSSAKGGRSSEEGNEEGHEHSIEELVAEKGITVYPNPNNGLFTLNLPSAEEAQILISNVSGQVVYRNNVSGTQKVSIDLSNKAQGIYVIQVVSGANTYHTRVNIQL
ncbi:MAG: HYR domain-containing protein [Taibaiella sp.]|nr:HYR domain-containing protein [Taibaiella sp.]